jgi:hypothetical protein
LLKNRKRIGLDMNCPPWNIWHSNELNTDVPVKSVGSTTNWTGVSYLKGISAHAKKIAEVMVYYMEGNIGNILATTGRGKA